jgi:hypothetical protein
MCPYAYAVHEVCPAIRALIDYRWRTRVGRDVVGDIIVDPASPEETSMNEAGRGVVLDAGHENDRAGQ